MCVDRDDRLHSNAIIVDPDRLHKESQELLAFIEGQQDKALANLCTELCEPLNRFLGVPLALGLLLKLMLGPLKLLLLRLTFSISSL